MTKPIILVLPVPPSANRLWATRVVTPKGKRPMAITYVTQEGVLFKDAVADLVRQAGVTEPIVGRVRVNLFMYPHRPQDWQKRQRQMGAAWDDSVRAPDLDNLIKPTLDGLKGHAFVDDVFVHEIVAKRMEPDEHGARVVVRVMALPVQQPQLAMEGGAE
jgi:crossover junction endodeoxyribonuclease RusA